jgi:hypothetical protein
MNGAATEAGRSLAPSIAELRARELGLEYTPETTEMFAANDEKIRKTGESREERCYDRQEKKKKKKREEVLEELEVPLQKRIKPERTDVKKVRLYAEPELTNKVEVPDIPFIDSDKAEEIGKKIIIEEDSKKTWVDLMLKNLKFSQNARRAALNLENEILVLNGTSNSKTRIQAIRKYLPQVFATRITEELPITDKVDRAKNLFSNDISNLTFEIESKLSKTSNINDVKEIIRSALRKEFQK